MLLGKKIQWILAIPLLWLPPVVVGSLSKHLTNKSNLYVKQINKNTVCLPLKLLIINCLSVLAKKPSFLNLINENNPDFIVGTGSWHSPNVNSSEIFPPTYTTLDVTEKIVMEEFS